MKDHSDPLDREIAVAARLEENGVAVKVKSRALAALDRLLGSLIDIPTAFAEGVSERKRLKSQVEERLRLAQAEMAEKRIQSLPGIGDVLLDEIFKDAARKQLNTAGVAIESVEAIKALPPPNPEQATESEIDQDWMNQFTRYAEDASSEQLQQLWGRVLAGEINHAGSFSRHTLRFIAELDKATAENCEYAAERSVGDWLPKSKDWETGEGLMRGLDLQRLGLLEGVGSLGLVKTFNFNEIGYKTFEKGRKALVVYANSGHSESVNAILLTRMGIEVFSLLTPKDNTLALRIIAEMFNKPGINSIELGRYNPDGDGIRFFLEEKLWPNN